jgi:predicted transcriptional regulator
LIKSLLIFMIQKESTTVRRSVMAQTETKVLTAHVPLPLAEKVDQMAARLERSRGWIMKQALSAWIDQEEERSRLTREALADVDAGRVIDHQTVQAWADSLSTDAPLPIPR